MQDAEFRKELERFRLNGKNAMLVVTNHFLVYANTRGTQRVPLAAVSKVVTDKSGVLTVDAHPHGVIEGSIRGFDATQLRAFFERVKAEIARAKQDVLEAEALPPPKPTSDIDWTEPFPPPYRSAPAMHLPALLASILLATVLIAALYWFLPPKPWLAVGTFGTVPVVTATYLLISRRKK